MEITRQYIENCLIQGAEDLREDELLVRGFNMGNGVHLYLRYHLDPEDPENIYHHPGKSIFASLRVYEGFKSSDNMKLYGKSVPMTMANREEIHTLAGYFAYQLGIESE